MENRRNSNNDGQRCKGRHEDRSLRDTLPRPGTRGRDVGVLRGGQRRHDGHRHESQTGQPEEHPDAARDRGLEGELSDDGARNSWHPRVAGRRAASGCSSG